MKIKNIININRSNFINEYNDFYPAKLNNKEIDIE